MKYIISVKPGIKVARSPADIVKSAILEADKGKVAEWIEATIGHPSQFLTLFHDENKKLLARLLKGEIKKKAGLKPEKGTSDFIIWVHYKRLRLQGEKRQSESKRQ